MSHIQEYCWQLETFSCERGVEKQRVKWKLWERKYGKIHPYTTHHIFGKLKNEMKFIVFSDKEIMRLRKLKIEKKKAKSQVLILLLSLLLSLPPPPSNYPWTFCAFSFFFLLSDEREERKLQDEAMKWMLRKKKKSIFFLYVKILHYLDQFLLQWWST